MARDSNKSSTVLRAFQVLECVAQSQAPVSASQVGTLTGLERVTAYRMLRTLEAAGYVSHDEHGKAFRMSPRVLSLARGLMAQDNKREKIDETLKRIAKRTGETCHYSELDGTKTTLTQRAKGSQLVAVDFQIGTRCELHATSVGKAILAYLPATLFDEYVASPMKTYTASTISDPVKLREVMDEIRQSGVSYDFEELSEGMNCVAVPLKSEDGQVQGGISISGPDSRLTRDRLKEVAEIIRQEIGRLEKDY
jgi:DNA-binding IclR family transcriptional regulator